MRSLRLITSLIYILMCTTLPAFDIKSNEEYRNIALGISKKAKQFYEEKEFKNAYDWYARQVDYSGYIKDNNLTVNGLNGMSRSAHQLGNYYEAIFWAQQSFRYIPDNEIATTNIKNSKAYIEVLNAPFKKSEYGRPAGKSFVSSLYLEYIDDHEIKFKLLGLRIAGSMLPVEEYGPAAYGSTSGSFKKVENHYEAVFDDYLKDYCDLTLSYEQDYTVVKLEGNCAYGGAGLYAQGNYFLLKNLEHNELREYE